jgi:hypothetical protein
MLAFSLTWFSLFLFFFFLCRILVFFFRMTFFLDYLARTWHGMVW